MIKKGDLVQVIRPTTCCGGDGSIGKIFTADYIENGYTLCAYCGVLKLEICARQDGQHWRALSRLRKIDPPSEGETREAYVNLKQPRKEIA